MASQDDGINQLRGINKNLSALVTTLGAAFPGSAVQGTFTCSAAATTVVSDTNVTATSVVLIVPSNAAAATLMAGSSSMYLSARTAGTSFAVATADSGSAAGTETFIYLIVNLAS